MNCTLLIANPYDPTVQRVISGLPAPTTVSPWPGELSFGSTGAETSVYLSDVGYTTDGDDDPPHQHFPGVLQPAMEREVVLFGGMEPSGEAPAERIGEVGILNAEREFDALTDLAWDGRSVEIRWGEKDAGIDTFVTVMRGTVAAMNYGPGRITLQLRDPGEFLQTPIERTRYSGNGGADGTADLAGVPRPLAFGRVRNVTPVVVDKSVELYQVHDGPVESIDGCRDGGVALTLVGDYPTVAALLAATTGIAGSGADIEEGEYATCLAEGYLRLGGQPDFGVTADVEGDKYAGVYVADTAGIVRRIVQHRLGVFGLADSALVVESFNALSVAQPAVVGYYVSEETPTVADIVGQLLAGIGAYWYFTRSGALAVGRLDLPSAPARTLTVREIGDLERLDAPQPVYRRRLGYRRMWTVQRDNDLAASVSAADRQLYGNEYRYHLWEDSSIRTRHRLARELLTPTFFDDPDDAAAENVRLAALHGVPRARWEVTINTVAVPRFSSFVGDEVSIDYPAYELDGGRSGIVVGLRESTHTEHTVLEVWT